MSYEAEKELLRQAKLYYEDFINNHPTIHTNRFPSWVELADDSKEFYIRRVKRDI